jgi:alpha-glucosidase (family GH31 glycosyl hydrolase)
MGIRVITWIVSVVNTDVSLWNMLDKNGWLIKNGIGTSGVIKWWHGKGSFIDYFHPDALAWWHQQLDKVLSIGIDGWKCDGTDPYIMEFVNIKSHVGPITYRDYANAYYGDFFDYSRTKNPDSLIMSRPCDDK